MIRPRIKMTVRKDKTARVLATIRGLTAQQVLVGVPAEEGQRFESGEPVNNASLALIHDQGAPRAGIPPRPFLREGVEDAAPQVAEVLGMGAYAALTKLNPGASLIALNKAGLLAVAAVKARIVGQVGFEPLQESTLANRARKGFPGTKALIWTGQLLNSITYVIRRPR